MPRIDPIQLLNCLGVLLSPHGGIKSQDEVQRLAKLMIKFSKKLVSKCIYIQILKCTETDLLGLFMGSGGWRLVHMWLTESIVSNNWPLVKELLELLLLCPVDIDQLKTNNCPKLVKGLSKEGNHFAIRALASKLVEQWLKTVKGEPVIPLNIQEIPQIITDAETEINSDSKSEPNLDIENVDVKNIETAPENDLKLEISEAIKPEKNKEDDEKETTVLPVLKISLKDGKQVISQVDDGKSSKESHKSKSKDRSHDKSSSSRSSSSKHSSSKSHSSSSDKHRSSSSGRKSSSSSVKSKDKDKCTEKEKGKESSSSSKSHKHSSDSSSRRSSSSSSNSKSKESSSKHSSDKDKIKDRHDKSKDSCSEKSDKLQIPSIQKLGKIPKLSDAKREKPSISIEVRKPDEPKPKTVKTFHSKFRKHGLEEESKPPPSRAAILSNKKPPPPLPPTVSIPKRPSPVHNEPPPEKKPKTIEPIEKPGSIKLIPPKPKPVLLLESDMFMDALTASTTNKKEPKKRKRRTSGSKDGHGEGSPTHAPNTPTATSPSAESKSVPPRFYQDTLDNDENKDKETPTDSREKSKDTDKVEDAMDTTEPHTLTINGLKGVLCYHKRKGPKKSIKWRPDSELEEIQYFELDETERVNVTKTFTDMKHLERIHEREAFEKGRNIPNDDLMEEKTSWRPLIPIDVEGQVIVEYGKLSKEKDIQATRQKGTLQPLYFHKSMIPDSGLEPDSETHTYSEPVIIPLEDVTGNQDNISDFRNMPWPEPKGIAPPLSTNPTISNNIFPPNMAQFPNGFPPAQFPGMPPGFQPPNIGPGDWPNGVPNMLPGPMNPMGLPPVSMPPGNMPPGLMVSPEELMMAEMFGAPNPMFGVPPDGFNMQQGMFPMDFGMAGPQGPPGPENFPVPGNFRGAMRGRGSNGHWRGKGPGNWDGPQRGKGGPRGGRKTVCIYFQRKGSCRQGDNCTFLHPGVHCPY